MSKNKKVLIITAATMAASVFLSGCGLFGGDEKKEIDPPQDFTYVDEGNSEVTGQTPDLKDGEGGEEASESTRMTELYLIDKNGYVVSQTMGLPNSEGVAKQALEYLVENGPVTDILPNGFRAVLPADTQISVNIKNGTATVDFSKEFQNYKAEDEEKILQSITWTLTQFDTINKVKVQMNGHELSEMPVSGTPIGEELSRANGINMTTADVVDITNTRPVTVYYLGGSEENYYYVPVTLRVSNKEKDNITAAVNELIQGPAFTSALDTDFLPTVKLLEKPKFEDGKVTLNFNEFVYGSFEEKVISQHALNSLVLSLTEQAGVESVTVLVNGKADIVNEQGQPITEPVIRPERVNTENL
ncbi:GerMN domain-containing protein [Mesobacillus harenae]|uniref:GerMN domain-containing protein n=1 Tax=Mesobacillus harenae TaxID=2213203 RepID=UPI0015802FA3|nr:GerMN domain-containing protein [Mesobacillus harenae]